MESIYIKRFTKQDITKSYSPSTDATRDFFCVDLNMTQDYVDLSVCYQGNTECPPGITIHKGYQGEKDWRICGDNFKPLYAFRNPEEGDLSVWKRIGKNGTYKFTIQVIKKNDAEYLDYSKFFSQSDNHLFLAIDNEQYTPSSYTPNFTQTIYYGVPGSGKSHKIDEELRAKIPNNEEREQQSMRVVFHPEYTNADFVGQILPVQTSEGIEYLFKAGPFSRILKRALKNPSKPYYLIIEEINRGNAAAIFGDLFQLLDRSDDGWSSYYVENLDINAFIRSSNDLYSEKSPEKSKTVGSLTFTENTSIRLPPNLALYATMNTSDQNVFTLDNAFQRRWDMQLVENTCSDTAQMNAKITVSLSTETQSISWGEFQKAINAIIGEKSNAAGLSSMEDKRLGCWFVKAKDGEILKEIFANKVLKYLWDDAFKFYHQEIFGEVKNFEELQNLFLHEKGFGIFSAECGLKIDSESSSE